MSDESQSSGRFTGLGARVIELMNDTGRLIDKLDSLPHEVKEALSDTLGLIADALANTEDTVKSVMDDFNAQLKSATETELRRAEIKVERVIEIAVDKSLTEKLNKASEQVDYINNTLNIPREISTRVIFLLGVMGIITTISLFSLVAILFLK